MIYRYAGKTALLGISLFVIGGLLLIAVVPGIVDKIFDDIITCRYGYDDETGELTNLPCTPRSDEAPPTDVTTGEWAIVYFTMVAVFLSPALILPWAYRARQHVYGKVTGLLILLYFTGLTLLLTYTALTD